MIARQRENQPANPNTQNSLPEIDWQSNVAFNPPAKTASSETEIEGLELYHDACSHCHGVSAVSGLLVPDLRGSGFIHTAEGWNQVVREGALASRGMADFSPWLTEEQSEAIRAYVIQEAWRAKKLQEK